jgi:PhoPQ-activated pathogenicity-related protein
MVDPWAYRDRLTLPKLIINGSNDFYWVTDALNLYWDELPGDKWVIYVPNAGHDLLGQDRTNSDYLVNGLAAFSRHQISGRAMPSLTWKHDSTSDRLRLTVEATPAPAGARLWVAQSATQDFRTAQWREQALTFAKGRVIGEVPRPVEGYTAFFGELDYEIDGLPYRLSTQVRMTGKAKQ